MVQQNELPLVRAVVGWRGRRPTLQDAATPPVRLPPVGEPELLATDAAGSELPEVMWTPVPGGLKPAQPTDAPRVHGHLSPAGVAHPDAVSLPPASASVTEPLGVPRDAPPEAVAAGGEQLRRGQVAAATEAIRVVVSGRPAAPARGRLDGPVRGAVEAVADLLVGHRPLPADAARTRRSHAGGSERWRPRRGVIGVAGPPWASRAGCRFLTRSGSRSRRSAGLHSRTAQITSRSSSRIVVGVLVQSADIFPALISSRHPPGVGASRSISRCRVRRLPCAGSSASVQPPVEPESARHPLVGDLPGLLDVVLVDVDVAGRRREPLVAEELLDRLEVDAAAYMDEAQKWRSPCGVSRPAQEGSQRTTAPARPSRSALAPTRGHLPEISRRRSLGSSGASGPTSRHRTDGAHRSSTTRAAGPPS